LRSRAFLVAKITPTLVKPFLFTMAEDLTFLAFWTFLVTAAFLTAALPLLAVALVLEALVFDLAGAALACGLAGAALVTLATAFFAEALLISLDIRVLTFGLAVGLATGFLVIDFLTAEVFATDLLLDGLAVAFLVEAVLEALCFLWATAAAFGISNFF